MPAFCTTPAARELPECLRPRPTARRWPLLRTGSTGRRCSGDGATWSWREVHEAALELARPPRRRHRGVQSLRLPPRLPGDAAGGAAPRLPVDPAAFRRQCRARRGRRRRPRNEGGRRPASLARALVRRSLSAVPAWRARLQPRRDPAELAWTPAWDEVAIRLYTSGSTGDPQAAAEDAAASSAPGALAAGGPADERDRGRPGRRSAASSAACRRSTCSASSAR